MEQKNLIFDFDSTLLKMETIEVLAEITLHDNKNKNIILEEIKNITNLAMSGKMPFSKALKKRISLLDIQTIHIDKTINFLKNELSNSFYETIENFEMYSDNIFIVSGGFKEIIYPILKPYGFNEKNIFANTFLTSKKGALTIDETNALSKDKGKVSIVNNISGYNIIIGDGYTDYELKKFGGAKEFVLFVENIYRKELKDKANYIAKNFNDVFEYINNV